MYICTCTLNICFWKFDGAVCVLQQSGRENRGDKTRDACTGRVAESAEILSHREVAGCTMYSSPNILYLIAR